MIHRPLWRFGGSTVVDDHKNPAKLRQLEEMGLTQDKLERS